MPGRLADKQTRGSRAGIQIAFSQPTGKPAPSAAHAAFQAAFQIGAADRFQDKPGQRRQQCNT
jgi:hypothetical protein